MNDHTASEGNDRTVLVVRATPDDGVATEDLANLIRDVAFLTDTLTMALTQGLDGPHLERTVYFRNGPRPPDELRLRLEAVKQESPFELVGSLPRWADGAILLVDDLVGRGLSLTDAISSHSGERMWDLLDVEEPRERSIEHREVRHRHGRGEGAHADRDNRLEHSMAARIVKLATYRLRNPRGYTHIETQVERSPIVDRGAV